MITQLSCPLLAVPAGFLVKQSRSALNHARRLNHLPGLHPLRSETLGGRDPWRGQFGAARGGA